MYYSAYYPCDFVNGEGIRNVLFVSGCEHLCRGCYNQKTWHPDFGDVYTQELEDKIINDLQNQNRPLDGLSLSGGDPLYTDNIPHIMRLITRVKSECPGKTIWLWTGYTIEELKVDPVRSPLLDFIDVLIDGKYEHDKRDITLPFRGSSNQRIIHLSNKY